MASSSNNPSSIPAPPPLPIDPSIKNFYIQKKSTNHKDWNGPLLVEWKEDFKTLKEGKDTFEVTTWFNNISDRLVDMHAIHAKDVKFGFKLQNAPTTMKRKGPLPMEKYMYSKINPLDDSLFVTIADSHSSDPECPCNVKVKNEKKPRKRKLKKSKQRESDDEDTDDADYKQSKRKKKRRKNKNKSEDEDEDSDLPSSDYDAGKISTKRSSAMFNQTMSLIIEDYKGIIDGDGMALFCDMICNNPRKYSLDQLPEFIRRKHAIPGSTYSTRTTHASLSPQPQQQQPPTTPTATSATPATTTTMATQQAQQQQSMSMNMMNPMMMNGMMMNPMMNPMMNAQLNQFMNWMNQMNNMRNTNIMRNANNMRNANYFNMNHGFEPLISEEIVETGSVEEFDMPPPPPIDTNNNYDDNDSLTITPPEFE